MKHGLGAETCIDTKDFTTKSDLISHHKSLFDPELKKPTPPKFKRFKDSDDEMEDFSEKYICPPDENKPFTKQYDEIKKIFLVSDYLNLETKKLYAGAHVAQLEAGEVIDEYLNTFSF